MYCLDTDISIEYLKGNPVVKKRIEAYSHEIMITPITAMELFYGAYRSANSSKHKDTVMAFLEEFPILNFSSKIFEEFGREKALLKIQGNLLDNFDLVIAVFCLVNNCTLITNNTKHFSRIKELKIDNWLH